MGSSGAAASGTDDPSSRRATAGETFSAARRIWAGRLLSCAIAGHLALGVWAGFSVGRHSGDFDRFWSIATSPGRPYSDFEVEYPPGTLFVFRAVARVAGSRDRFRVSLVAMNVVADVAIVSALAWGWGPEAALFYALAALPILSLVVFRVDLWSAAAATIAIAAWQRQQRLVAGIALSAGVAIKIWPLPFAVLLLVPRRGRLVAAALFAGSLVLLAAWWWSLAGARGFAEVLTFRESRGWQIESTIGSVVRLVDAASVRQEGGAFRVGSTNGVTSIALFLLAALPSVGAIWLGARQNRAGVAWLAGVGAILVCSSLLSPQFLLWLIPGAAIAWKQEDRPLAVVALAAVVQTGLYRSLHVWPPLVIVRNITLLALTGAAIASLLKQHRNERS